MGEVAELSTEERELMVKYNITVETKRAFYFEDYKYDKLDDAVRYARLSAEREKDTGDD